jgi:hypothetical protein
MNNPKLIISDFDEVICDCSLKWIKKIQTNCKKFNLEFDDPRFETLNTYLRPVYHIDEWFQFNTPQQLLDFKELYYSDNTFYDNIELSKAGKFLQFASNQPKAFKLVIISVSKGGMNTAIAQSKMNFLRRNFNMENIEVHLVEKEKATLIKDQYKDWDILFEDSLDHIVDILKQTDLEEKTREILIPSYGWNIDSTAVNEMIYDTSVSLMYYYYNGEPTVQSHAKD